jgi:hypothetical protein
MVSDIESRIEIDIDEDGNLHCLLGDIARSLELIKDELTMANRLKAEELVANRRAGSMDNVDALLLEHWSSISAHS